MAGGNVAPTKVCTKCGEEMPLDRFSRDRSKPDGRQTRCKACRARGDRDYYQMNAERVKASVRAAWLANKGERTAVAKAWASDNTEKMAEYRRAWRSRNRDAERAAERERILRKRRADGAFRMNRALARSLWGILKGRKAGRSWLSLVGYGADDLVAHIQRQFVPGMTWDNYGSKWHVDHIRPVSSFDFRAGDHDEIRACWAMTNLRPLWASQNLRKNRRLELLV